MKLTPLQEAYLRFIRDYIALHRQAPAESDMQAFFHVSPPSVHRMVMVLAEKGVITREPHQPRSIRPVEQRLEANAAPKKRLVSAVVENAAPDDLDRERAKDVIDRMLVATEALMAGAGPLKWRLLRAFEAVLPLREDDFPIGAAGLFTAFLREMTVHEDRSGLGIGAAEFSVHRMKGPQAKGAARTFSRLHEAVVRVLAEE